MGRKAKQYTVQLTQNLELMEKQAGWAYTATGVRVDVGLPKGHHAVLHEAPHPLKGWRVTHEESGLRISPFPYAYFEWAKAEDAVTAAKQNVESHFHLGDLNYTLESGIKTGEAYRRKLWEHAGNFVI